MPIATLIESPRPAGFCHLAYRPSPLNGPPVDNPRGV